jgi:hypothetical protein
MLDELIENLGRGRKDIASVTLVFFSGSELNETMTSRKAIIAVIYIYIYRYIYVTSNFQRIKGATLVIFSFTVDHLACDVKASSVHIQINTLERSSNNIL